MTLLIDVRDAEEYALSHAEGAVSLPLMAILFGNLGVLAETDKNTRIELYCHSGGRAERAREVLTQLGFTDVVNRGGLEEVAEERGLVK